MEVKLEPLLDTLKLVNISDQVYFTQYSSNYISNSRMKLINEEEGGSPELYDKGVGNNYSKALMLGSAVHATILSEDEFDVVLSNRPSAKLGFVIDEIFKLRRQDIPLWKCFLIASDKVGYYKGKLTDRLIKQAIAKGLDYYLQRLHTVYDKELLFLDTSMYDRYKQCINSLKTNKQITELLNPSTLIEPAEVYNEYTIFLDMKATLETGKTTILKLKAKLDNFTLNRETGELVLNDLKTTGKFLYKFRDESFQRFHYFRQASFYAWLLKLVAKHILHFDYNTFYVNFLVVSTIPDYRSDVFKCPQDQIIKGFEEMKRLLKQIAIHQVCKNDLSRAEFDL